MTIFDMRVADNQRREVRNLWKNSWCFSSKLKEAFLRRSPTRM